jgi:hypothetical protein
VGEGGCERAARERLYGCGAQAGADGWAGAGARARWGLIGWLLASVGPVGGWFR